MSGINRHRPIQFPFYAVIFGMIVGTGIADALAKLFASISTHNTYRC
jgi:short subunit fatty acids transporter